MRGASAIVAAVLASGCQEKVAPAAKAPIAAGNALEVALTLAHVRGLPMPYSDAEWIERYRVECEVGCALLRRYRVAAAPSETSITADEMRNVLLTAPPAAGEVVELFEPQPPYEVVIAAFLDPRTELAARTERLTGVGAAQLEAQVRDVLRIDLAKGEIDGASWREPRAREPRAFVAVVERVTNRAGQIALADARLLVPGAEVGKPIEIRRSVTPIRLPQPRLHAPGAVSVTTYREDFERLRALAKPMPTPAAIAEAIETPIYQLYPEGYGVGFIEVPARDVTGLWKQLDAEAPRTGLRPLYFIGDRQDLLDTRVAWRDLSDTPEKIIASVASVHVPTTLRPAGTAKRGPWPTTTPARVWDFPSALEHGEPTAFMLLVPTDAAWKVPTFMPGLYVYSEGATPHLGVLAAVAQRWDSVYGVRLVGMGAGIMQWYLSRPLSRVSATALALEVATLAPAAHDGTVEELAAALVAGSPFTTTWD